MDKIKKIARSTEKFVDDHKVAITFTAMTVMHVIVIRKYNNFLKEHDLFDEFFKLDEN